MTLFSHVVAGSVIAETPLAPAIQIVLSFLSHFILDMIPHVQEPSDEGYKPNAGTYFFVSIDIAASAVYLWWFWGKFGFSLISFLVVVASVLPDIIDVTRNSSFFYKTFRFYYDFHDKIQRETRKPVGYVTQVLLAIGCVAYLVVK